VLLLDEPTQGMSHGDTEDTTALIKSLATEVTVLLIEHDIGLVMNLSDHVIVLHQGKKLFEGTPAAVRANPAVQTAYFGQA
jgi:branched-chain amino acid transport system ATP-binding protein